MFLNPIRCRYAALAVTMSLALWTGGCSKDDKPAGKSGVSAESEKEGAGTAEKDDEKAGRKGGKKQARPPRQKKSSEEIADSGRQDAGPRTEPVARADVKDIAAGPHGVATAAPADARATPGDMAATGPAAPTDQAARLTDLAVAAPAAARTDPARPSLADPRLLLTMTDIAAIAPSKASFVRAPLAGMPRTEDSDSIMYVPEKGDAFGFALQLFRSRNALETKKRFEALQASYPSSQEIAAVSGKTFFSYWNDAMHIGFVHPAKNLTVVVSCGRQFCDSDKLMELSGKIAERLK